MGRGLEDAVAIVDSGGDERMSVKEAEKERGGRGVFLRWRMAAWLFYWREVRRRGVRDGLEVTGVRGCLDSLAIDTEGEMIGWTERWISDNEELFRFLAVKYD